MSKKYGIHGLKEAKHYLRHPTLGKNFISISQVVRTHLESGAQLSYLMGGSLDANKLVSSMTLFEAASKKILEGGEGEEKEVMTNANDIFSDILHRAEQQGFRRCQFTLNNLGDDTS